MKVAELEKILKNLPKDTEVLLAKDEEGNGFRKLFEVTAESMSDEGRGNFGMVEDEEATHVVLWPN